MKKFMAIVLSLTMALTVLAGCGGQSGNTGKADTTAAESKPDGAQAKSGEDGKSGADEAPYEVIVELIGSGVAQPDTAEVEAAINEITVPAINCTVKFREITIADHAQQLNLLGTDGDRIDIVFAGYTTSTQSLVANGLLLPLGDLLKEYAPEMLEKAGDLMEACYIGDDYYCVPGNYYPASRDAVTYGIEDFEKYNIEIPENPESTIEYLDKLYQNIKNSDFPGYAFTAGDGPSVAITGTKMDKFGSAMGADGIYGVLMDMTKDTQIVNVFETEEYLNQCKQLRKWWEEGIMVPDSMTSGTTAVAAMMAHQVCISLNPINATSVNNSKKITGVDMGEIPFGETYLIGQTIPEYSLGVTVTSERPEKAVQLLNMIMTNGELANLMNYGIEGKHYVKVSEHIIDFPEGVDFSNTGYGLQIVTFGDLAQVYQKAPYTEEWYDTLDQYSAKNAKLSTAFGYVFDTTPVKTQVAAVSSVVGEYNASLMCGMVEDVEGRIADFNAALKTAGIDEIIAENQRQFDAWRAARNK